MVQLQDRKIETPAVLCYWQVDRVEQTVNCLPPIFQVIDNPPVRFIFKPFDRHGRTFCQITRLAGVVVDCSKVTKHMIGSRRRSGHFLMATHHHRLADLIKRQAHPVFEMEFKLRTRPSLVVLRTQLRTCQVYLHCGTKGGQDNTDWCVFAFLQSKP